MKRALLWALSVAVVSGAAWLVVTSAAPEPWVATWAPCPRNWGWAPAWMPRQSPLENVRFRVGSVDAKVCYGSPALRGREMLGGAAVPFGRLWRTGANEPTTLHLNGPVRFGTVGLAAGSYSLYSIPDGEAWQILVNRSTRQWGLESEYTVSVASAEVGRFTVRPEILAAPVERLRFRWEPGRLILEWQRAAVGIPVAADPGAGTG